MKIAYLGAGAWGFCLARLLAKKGHTVTSWSIEKELLERIHTHNEHPALPGRGIVDGMHFTGDLEQALDGAEMIVEAVTAAGVRPVFADLAARHLPHVPIVFTSKGVEQKTGLILSDIGLSLLGDTYKPCIASMSGPSFADEVSRELPTAVVCASYNKETALAVIEAFATNYFRIYHCADVRGVAFGGALKNIIAIACGIAEGLGLGTGAKAALMTRGLREIVRLAVHLGCQQETLYGLSCMGDLFLTCSSPLSRNFRFGTLLAGNYSPSDAKAKIGAVVEGAYSAITADELAKKYGIPMPITQAVVSILDGKLTPQNAVNELMQRSIKEEGV